MAEKPGRCAACGEVEVLGTRMSQVVVEGRTSDLCRTHAAMVALARPETFDDLRALFVGMSLDDLRHGQKERRSPIERRVPEDRRVFPPRPEGRRRSFGRRATDPRD
jgi:hypothetical protein